MKNKTPVKIKIPYSRIFLDENKIVEELLGKGETNKFKPVRRKSR